MSNEDDRSSLGAPTDLLVQDLGIVRHGAAEVIGEGHEGGVGSHRLRIVRTSRSHLRLTQAEHLGQTAHEPVVAGDEERVAGAEGGDEPHRVQGAVHVQCLRVQAPCQSSRGLHRVDGAAVIVGQDAPANTRDDNDQGFHGNLSGQDLPLN